MPLSPHALADARVTAGRIVMLLPGHTGATTQNPHRTVNGFRPPRWLLVAFFGVVFAAVVVAGIFATAPTTPAPVARSTEYGK
jgi:hypothetical protein